jgi:hypothetical protein
MTLFYENREHVEIGGSSTGITPYGGGWFFSKFKIHTEIEGESLK